MGESTILFKSSAAVVIFTLNAISSCLPFYISSSAWISRAESLAGGVFIGAGFGHLFPESLHAFQKITHLPIGPIISIIFFSILFIIEIFTASKSHHHNDSVSSDSDSKQLVNSKNDSKKIIDEELLFDRSEFSNFSNGSGNIINKKMGTSSFLVYLTLVFHGFVEACAFGIINTKSVLVALLCAIVGHKPVETFALGLLLQKEKISKKKYFSLMLLFSSVAPLTIVIMMYATFFLSDFVFGIVASASTGVFLFVGFHEIMELLSKSNDMDFKSKTIHVGMYLLGVLWMIIIALIGGEHEH